jgi:lipoprotein-anchoring transpeptidase ErfK/SrfK
MVHRRKVILGAVGAAAALTVAGCSSSSKPKNAAAAGGADSTPVAGTWQTPTATAVSLTVSPKAGTTKVSVIEPVTVAVEGGKLQSVTVASGGKKVSGTVDAASGTWKSTGHLSYGKKYTVTASVQDSTGAVVKKTSTFTTLKPAHTAGVTFQANGLNVLHSGGTYGMGQPVIVAFGHSVTDKDAAEKAISVQTSPSVEGKFHWVSNSIVHWRPEKYWKKGTTIKVAVDALGVNLGGGVYGSENASTHFTIGRQLLAVSDNNTHHTKVYIDGKLVRDMKCSNGRGGYTKGANGQSIHFWTQEGPHVVLSKEATHTMSSASYGLTDPKNPNYYAPEVVKLCTRISYSGEFLHAAPWNHVLGSANISHGCINLSESDARWVYDNFLIGDVVNVVHTPKPLPLTDGLGDWTVSFEKYGK